MKHLKKFESSRNIEKFSNDELLSHYSDAVCDHNYNPGSEDYNQSGFTKGELEAEILRRMKNPNQEKDYFDYLEDKDRESRNWRND